jgi:DNA-binding NarL/FixJ family response regulator
MPVTLVLFEDNYELRQALVNLLQSSEQYIVAGDYNEAVNAVEIVRAKQPEVVILDINMPGISGIEAIPLIKEEKPDAYIIMYTQFENDENLFKSLCAGADGYILKKTAPFKLVDAIDEVCNGGAPLSPAIAKKVLGSFKVNRDPAGLRFNLTPREAELLQLLVKGYSVKLIASELNISYDTARTHLRNVYRKLHVNCGKEAIAKILSEKITI